jgi:hypothetical protein
VFLIIRRRKKGHPSQDKEWYFRFALSKEDAVSQLFLLLSFFFLGVTLLSFNRDLGDPFSWRIILFITSVIGLVSTYSFKTIYTLVFSLIGFTGWWVAQATEWLQSKDIKTSAIFAGLTLIALLFYVLGHLHEKEIKFKRFALVFLVLGIIVITGVLFFFSTKSGLDVLGSMTEGKPIFGSWQITLSLFIFMASIVGVTLYSVGKRLILHFELIAVFVFTALFGLIALLPEQNMFVHGIYSGSELSGKGVFWSLIFNLAIFLELFGLIFSGYLRKEVWFINLGAFFLFLLIIVKYFDWFFTFLDKSIFFIGAGILLFIVGWFMEKGRRYILKGVKSESQQISQ